MLLPRGLPHFSNPFDKMARPSFPEHLVYKFFWFENREFITTVGKGQIFVTNAFTMIPGEEFLCSVEGLGAVLFPRTHWHSSTESLIESFWGLVEFQHVFDEARAYISAKIAADLHAENPNVRFHVGRFQTDLMATVLAFIYPDPEILCRLPPHCRKILL